MVITKKEQKRLTNAIVYGLRNIVSMSENSDENLSIESLANFIDIFQVLLYEINNAEIKEINVGEMVF